MRRFFAPPDMIEARTVRLDAEESRHLSSVLRLKPGELVRVFDGAGREYECRIVSIGRAWTELEIDNEVEPTAPESPLELRLVVSAYKADKLDLVVQKAVELGVARLSPVISAFSEVRLKQVEARTERLRKIAMEATKQCERAKVMTVDKPAPFADYLKRSQEDDPGVLLIFSEKGGGPMPSRAEDKKITAIVGPKGGWADAELELARAHGFESVKLGRRIMKAETAAITFAALLQHRFGDLN